MTPPPPIRRAIAIYAAAIAQGRLEQCVAHQSLAAAWPGHDDDLDALLLDAIAVCEACDLHELRTTTLAAVR